MLAGLGAVLVPLAFPLLVGEVREGLLAGPPVVLVPVAHAGHPARKDVLRGFGDDFWSTFVEPDPDKPDKRTLTVWGQGTININTANAQTLLAFVCSSAPASPMCTDPAEAQKFLMLVTMLRGAMAGVPVFGSTDDFIATLLGKGKQAEIFKAVGIQPVTFLSQDQAKKMISVESKLFSLYVTGVVKGAKRETRVRVHAGAGTRGRAGAQEGNKREMMI